MPDYHHEQVDGVEVVHRSDSKNSISGWLGLTRYHGMLAGVVESNSAKHQVTALLDLMDLHLSKQGVGEGIALLLHQPHPEAASALEVLRNAVRAVVPVRLLRYEQREWTPLPASDFDVTAAHLHYPRWTGLLGADFTVPALVREIVAAVELPEVRAYPQLTAKGEWSIRVEGLQVGRVLGDGTGWLDVGSLGKLGDTGPERRAWLEVSPPGRFPFDSATFMEAADKVREFAHHWRSAQGGAQNEHVLESRILRGDVEVVVDHRPLQLIRDNDGIVNWGSQFPTKWGLTGKARYLDALLRDPVDTSVPWAIEMKVRLSEGQYYRHAVAQAVLYRHFIRGAKELHSWFDHYDLDASLCRAAVVVPEFKSSTWHARLTELCKTFGVSLATVPEAATIL